MRPRHNLTQTAICLDRALDYEVSLHTKYTLNSVGMYKCCPDNCYAYISRLALAHFRVSLVHNVGGALTEDTIRKAVATEVRKRSRRREDGLFEVETYVGEIECACLPYFYAALGLSRYAMETIYREAWNMSETQIRRYYGNNCNARSLARVSIKIRDMGEFHPVDASIMVPPSETRSHFLRTGRKGAPGSVLKRRMLTVHFGATVRVHKASSFMKCACCIAMKLYAEDRVELMQRVTALLADHEHAKNDARRGVYVKAAARALAEGRLGGKNYVDMRNKLRDARKAVREAVEGLEHQNEIDDYVDVGGDEGRGMEDADNGEDGQRLTGPISSLDFEINNLHLAFLDDSITLSDYLKGMKGKVKKLADIENVMKRFHYKCIQLERVLVYSAQEAAASCPEEVCALIIDGCGKERTKLPHYPNRIKGVGEDPNLIKCPLVGVQEAVPVADSARGSHMGESDFALHTTDYIIALEWTKVGGADLYASILLDFLVKKNQVPRVLVLILDNAPVNKGEPLMAWLAYIMLNTEIEEVNVYYPTTGHTHTSLDAHFGKVKPKDATTVILTPQDLKRHLESLPRVRAILNFALYSFADKLSLYAHSYSNRLDQHHYVLFKDKTGDIRFKYSPLMRYAEHLTARVRNLFALHPYFMYMSDEERTNGIPVFRQDEGATAEALDDLSAQCNPSPWEIPDSRIYELISQIPEIHSKRSKAREQQLVEDLSELGTLAKPDHDFNLAEILAEIKAKACPRNPVIDPDEDGTDIVSDLMDNVKFRKRSLLGETEITKAGDVQKIRTVTARKVLEILSGAHQDIHTDFTKLARKSSKSGGMEKGYKGIVEELERDLGIVPANGPRSKRLMSASAMTGRTSSASSSRAGSMPPPAVPPARLPSATPSPMVSTRPSPSPSPSLAKRARKSKQTEEEEEEEDETEQMEYGEDDDDAMSTASSSSALSTRSGRARKPVRRHEAEP